MGDPPRRLDGAVVLRWAVSPAGGFDELVGTHPPVTVAAMAICRYPGQERCYLFKCTREWEVVQDCDCESEVEALRLALEHAGGQALDWRRPA
jgi:hypothetical protein